jgi:polysaccharide export outer membrane protein
MAMNTSTRTPRVSKHWNLSPKRVVTGAIILSALAAGSQQLPAQQRVQPVNQRRLDTPANTVAPTQPTGLPSNTAQGASVQPASAPALHIAGGDLLQVTVFDTPELSSQLRVAQTGEIELPWGGSLHVEGSTPEQASEAIEASLKNQNILKYPHRVTVFIAEYATQGVKVLGQVKTPGVYPLLGTHRLYDMIASAGGVTDFAARQVIIVHQNDTGHPITAELNYNPDGIEQSDIDVLPGDTIVVQKAGVVYVLGDVGRPGGFLIEDNQPLTVLRALSLAQGVNKTAKLNSTVIFRHTATGQTQSPLALKQVLHGKATDLALSDHDILYVPSSIEKTLGYRGIELAAQATAGVNIYK